MFPIAHKALRPIALFEALKGVVVLVAGFGALSFLGRDTQQFATHLVQRLHLDPAAHYPRIFIHAMSSVTDTRVWLMAGFAAFYAAVRFAEAYGLWHERRWAEWFAAFSGGINIPVELYELSVRITWPRLAALIFNVVIVAYMVWLLGENRRRAHAEKKLTSVR